MLHSDHPLFFLSALTFSSSSSNQQQHPWPESFSAAFSWTPLSKRIALVEITRLVEPMKDDPFKENNLTQVVSQLNAKTPQSPETLLLQHLTTADLSALLQDCHQLYQRVCELANHPSVLGFTSRSSQIVMLPNKYTSHIQVVVFFIIYYILVLHSLLIQLLLTCQAFPKDKGLIDKPIPDFPYL